MTTTLTADSTSARSRAAVRLYEAETALHHARQTGVDEWIAAAYNRLHDAVLAYQGSLVPNAA